MSEQRVKAYQQRVEQALERCLPPAHIQPQRLHEAMRYSTLAGGKRVRPVLVYAAAEAVGLQLDAVDACACAVELIHAYSLIHDDLPAMDDDDLRRGRPTCHRAFDEATAILAGDGLQALAFRALAHCPALRAAPALGLEAVELLAQAAGSRGMVGGQAIDLAAVGHSLTLVELENMHIHKTGALIRASVQLGALAAQDLDPAAREGLDHYAKCVGLAFQVVDDILDVTTDTATLGKRQGADRALGKPTYPELLGLQGAREQAGRLHADALQALATLGPQADTLRWLATYIVERSH